jgi:xanthine dehydrogenase YagR molybdenum-binding subunit
MGLPLERVTFQLGDSTLPLAPVEGGSSHVATVGGGVAGACEKLQNARCSRWPRMPAFDLQEAAAAPGGIQRRPHPPARRSRPTARFAFEVLAHAGKDASRKNS